MSSYCRVFSVSVRVYGCVCMGVCVISVSEANDTSVSCVAVISNYTSVGCVGGITVCVTMTIFMT